MKSLNKKNITFLTKIVDPFIMVDRIENIEIDKSSIGIKKIYKNSWFLKCHFLNNPVMPGTLIEESILQTIVSTLYSGGQCKDKICLITSSKTNFYSKVNKPTTLKIFIKITKITKLKVISSAIVTNNEGIKIATGQYKYFLSQNEKKN